MEFKATKDLVNDTGVRDFTKGQTYKRYQTYSYSGSDIKESTTLVNDHGEPHRVGNWVKHFKPVKS